MINVLIPPDIQELLDTFAFRGNNKLRPEGTSIGYTPEMLSELLKCKKDPVYFIENYFHIINLDEGVILFKLHKYQKTLIRSYHKNRKCITLLGRQMGKTTTTAAFICWYVLFNKVKTAAVMANKLDIAIEILSKIKMGYELIPLWMQKGVVEWNKKTIILDNGSRVIAAATSASGMRGFAISLLYLDEMAHIENNVAEDFFTSMFPTLSSGKETKILISSTPKGYNLFHKMWNEAEKGLNGFVTNRFEWWDHPSRNQKWADEQRAALGELKYNQEVLMTFLGSSMTLLNNETLSRLTHDQPIQEYNDHYKGLKVYAQPEKGRIYSLCVDVSRGRHLDYSAAIVFDITAYPHTIAATYRNNEIPPLLYASILHTIGLRYNSAYMLIEINDIGAQVADSLWNDLEYEAMHFTKSGDELGKQGQDDYPGIRTTKKTKRIGCANLKDMIDNNQLLVNDYDIVQELSTFTQSKTGSYEADSGFHDDMVMCCVLHAWMVSQRWFAELTDSSLRLKLHSQHIQEMEDQIMLTVYFDDGNEAYEETVDNYW
jgi:hypothetical protein